MPLTEWSGLSLLLILVALIYSAFHVSFLFSIGASDRLAWDHDSRKSLRALANALMDTPWVRSLFELHCRKQYRASDLPLSFQRYRLSSRVDGAISSFILFPLQSTSSQQRCETAFNRQHQPSPCKIDRKEFVSLSRSVRATSAILSSSSSICGDALTYPWPSRPSR